MTRTKSKQYFIYDFLALRAASSRLQSSDTGQSDNRIIIDDDLIENTTDQMTKIFSTTVSNAKTINTSMVKATSCTMQVDEDVSASDACMLTLSFSFSFLHI